MIDRLVASTFTDMDFAGVARAMGCRGIRVERAEEIAPALGVVLGGAEPSVVDVITSFRSSFRDVTSPLAAN